MRYKLFSDNLINMRTPSFLRGRKHILWLQSLVYPLQVINDAFQQFAKDKLLEAKMTSQVMWLEWYLNYKFRQYFINESDGITFKHFVDFGVPFYQEGEPTEKFYVVYQEGELVTTTITEEEPKPLYFINEALLEAGASFEVLVPPLTIPAIDFDPMISYVLNRYRIAGKVYKITHQ